jgi:formate/nitrite transporter
MLAFPHSHNQDHCTDYHNADGGLFSSPVFHSEAIIYAASKVLIPSWTQIFLRGILANWLVTMAVFLSNSSREIVSKIIAIWFPTMAFTALGGDHVVANMFYIPLGIFLGAPVELTVGKYIWKSMIPAALGNIIGGGLFVGVLYWYLYLTGDENRHPNLSSTTTTNTQFQSEQELKNGIVQVQSA